MASARLNCGLRSMALLASMLAGNLPATAADLHVFVAIPFTPMIEALASDFEQFSGHKLRYTSGSGATLKSRINRNEPFDAAILLSTDFDELAASHKIDSAWRMPLARSGMGMGVRSGTPRPDISNIEGLRRVLLNANAVAHSNAGPSRIQFFKVLAQLSISADMQGKLRPMPAGATAQPVANGEVDVVVTNIAPILGTKGVDFVGPLPSLVQAWTTFEIAVSSSSRNWRAALDLQGYLVMPRAGGTITSKGMEPVTD